VYRWLRGLHAQLFLWAVLPVTFVIIALAFTGVYTHQQAMRDFLAERDLALARLTVHMVQDGLAHGVVGSDGMGLSAWMSPILSEQPEAMVVDGKERVLAHPDLSQVGADLKEDAGVTEALREGEGTHILRDKGGEPILIAFAPVSGTDWVVLVREPVEGLIGPILRLSNLAPVVAVGAGILSLLILTSGWRTIVHPLQQLVRATGQISWGDYSAISAPVGGVQEIRDLHHALTEMVERIRGYQAGIRDYLGAVTRAQEAERSRLARELHDGPVQELIALGQRAEMAQRSLRRDDTDRAQVLLGELLCAERETVQELRRMIGALRPIYLEDLGLLPALEMLVQQAAARTPARVRLEQEGSVERFVPEVELAAYRIAQQALNNAVQHAQAQIIVLSIRCDSDSCTLAVTDDGIGFTPPQRPDRLTQAGHFGLVGMRERATQLGGSLQIRTAPGAGTQVTAQLPNPSFTA
jgi:two-component system sensor histidine kinase UhpB